MAGGKSTGWPINQHHMRIGPAESNGCLKDLGSFDNYERTTVTTRPPRSPEHERHRLTVIRQGVTRDQTKYSAGGREKRRTRATPSLPQLKCLKGDPRPPP
jgi:hypothetical protein